ncbi:unnamed protein product [Chironomus riparius]|uniref:Uncharacterized protein n=1 Tax=Chironomus riparius TaxID=315576 RepID=A0A9N9WRC7_9DIPT|nr:unnamed protein product [Chironomus riparius]
MKKIEYSKCWRYLRWIKNAASHGLFFSYTK